MIWLLKAASFFFRSFACHSLFTCNISITLNGFTNSNLQSPCWSACNLPLNSSPMYIGAQLGQEFQVYQALSHAGYLLGVSEEFLLLGKFWVFDYLLSKRAFRTSKMFYSANFNLVLTLLWGSVLFLVDALKAIREWFALLKLAKVAA